ncbi:hypothetical protein FACS189437_05060 [Bacteroidia bacterium]|nr:hypothetical protein FACS189437_05060 [Bacteroidia bacterium]
MAISLIKGKGIKDFDCGFLILDILFVILDKMNSGCYDCFESIGDYSSGETATEFGCFSTVSNNQIKINTLFANDF